MSNFEINTNFTIAILCSKHVNFFCHKRDQTYLQNIQLYPESQVKWNSFFTICSMRLYGSKHGILINIALVEYDLSGKIHSFFILFSKRPFCLLLSTKNDTTVAHNSGNDQRRLSLQRSHDQTQKTWVVSVPVSQNHFITGNRSHGSVDNCFSMPPPPNHTLINLR